MLFLSFIIITYYGAVVSAAHSGNTDSFGCHAGSKPYHCHGRPDNSNYNITDGERVLLDRYKNGYTPINSYDNKSTTPLLLIPLVGIIAGFIRNDDINNNKNYDQTGKLDPIGFGICWAIITYCLLQWFYFQS
jgi:hypothetical protein